MNARKLAEIVHPVFVAQDWKWVGPEGFEVPSVDRIVNRIQSMLASLAASDKQDYYCFVECGRLGVYSRFYDDGPEEIGVYLTLADSVEAPDELEEIWEAS